MGINYNKYIKRLQARRAANPELAIYRQSISSLAEPVKLLNRTTQGAMRFSGGSIGTIAQTGLSSQQMLQNMASNAFQTADRSALQHNAAIDERIDQLEMAQDQQREAEKQKKKAKKESILKGALQVGGTLLGAAAGTLLAPGAGTAAGATLAAKLTGAQLGATVGSGLGTSAASFIGDTDPEMLIAGVKDMAAGLEATATLQIEKQQMKQMGEALSKFQLMPEDKRKYLIGLLQAGMFDEVIALTEGY